MSFVQQIWPFSSIGNPESLKEIISREYNKNLAEEIFSECCCDADRPMIKLLLDKTNFKGLKNVMKKSSYTFQAQLGYISVDFINRYKITIILIIKNVKIAFCKLFYH